MRKINNKSIIIMITIISYLILSCLFLINKFSNIYSNVINPAFWILSAIVCYNLFKNEYVNKKYKFDILQTVIITLIMFFIIYYFLGIIIGFQDTPYSTTFKGIVKNMWSFGVIIVFQEYIRKVLINRSGKNKMLLALITIIFVYADISKILVLSEFNTSVKVFQFIVITLNPAIAKSILLTYLTYKADVLPSLIYKMTLNTYSFIVPFIPKLNWFLIGVIDIVLPFILFITVHKNLYKKEEDSVKNKSNYKGMLLYTPIFTILTVLVILVSGLFRYQIIAIASDSMNPVFYKGDAVILKKIDKENKDKIKVGKVIVYNSNGTYIVHRVIEKKETMTGTYLYKTKGDNNESPDSKLVEPNQIIGEVSMFVKFIGYPTVLLQEALSKR